MMKSVILPAMAVVLLFAILFFIGLLIYHPVRIAKERQHPKVGRIALMTACSIICPPCWLLALYWAYNPDA